MPNALLNQTIITPSMLPSGGTSTDEQRNAWFQAMKETLAGDPVNLQMGTDDELRIVEMNMVGESLSLDSPYDGQTPFYENVLSKFNLYERALRGMLFVYPAGERWPLQLQVGPNGEFAMSKPLTRNAPEAPYEPLEPESMSTWERFANWCTGGWAYAEKKRRVDQQVEKYQSDLDNYNRYTAMINRIEDNAASRTYKCCEQERQEVRQRKEAVEAEKVRQENERRERAAQEERQRKEAVEAEKVRQENEQRERAAQEERQRKEAVEAEKVRQENEQREKAAQEERQRQEPMLKKLQKGLKDRKKHIQEFAKRMDRALELKYPEYSELELNFTEHEISALMLGAMMSAARKHPAPGRSGEETAREVYGRNLKDTFMSREMKVPLADVEAGVTELKEILGKLSKERMELLPLLVDTLRMNNKLILQEPGLTDEVAMIGKLSGTMLQILRGDPELMRQAKEAGLTDEELRQAKASAALAEIRENGLTAQGKLLENAIDGMESYDPAPCVNQIAQMRLLDQKIAENYKKCVDSGAEVSPEPFQLQVLGGAPTTEAALRELDKSFKPILEQSVAQKSALDLVNEWVGPAASAPKKEAVVKEQPPKAKVEEKKNAPSAESKTDAEIRQDMKKKLFKKFADDKKVKQQQKLP